VESLWDNFYSKWQNQLIKVNDKLDEIATVEVSGKLVSAGGTVVSATLSEVNIGDICLIYKLENNFKLYAEVISLDGDMVKLLPFGSVNELAKGSLVKKVSSTFKLKVGDWLLGKVVNGFGEVKASLIGEESAAVDKSQDNYEYYSLHQHAPEALSRSIITQQLYTGVKVIDLFISCGLGQRIAIFAAPGMGKTTLMGMITRNSSVDVIIIALIGERGREVQEFIDLELTPELKAKCILIVTTSDRPPVERVKAVYVAHTVAEYFRDQGKNVLLLLDSVTRFARAMREVALSNGEPAVRNGYPPSVLLSFASLMERAGTSRIGSISAFYTVLLETEDISSDVIAEEVKSIVDGHIMLSRKLVEQAHFPAINVLSSLSRIADRIISKEHLAAARKIRQLLSRYQELEFLLRVGEYKEGVDPLSDEAVRKHNKIMKFLQQNTNDKCDFKKSLRELVALSNG
jgi:type III secretion protein N (ATPase)